MCWISKNIPELKIAEKDIEVEKVLHVENDIISSPIQFYYTWNKGIVQEVKNFYNYWKCGNNSDPFYVKYSGFHSCEKISYKNGYWYTSRNNSREFLKRNSFDIVFNAIIPKGSKYYLNEYGEYVSDKLMIV